MKSQQACHGPPEHGDAALARQLRAVSADAQADFICRLGLLAQ